MNRRNPDCDGFLEWVCARARRCFRPQAHLGSSPSPPWSTPSATGLFFTASALFLTRSVGLSVRQVGVGLTIAGLVGLLANVPAGRIAEIAGPARSARDHHRASRRCSWPAMHSFIPSRSFLVVACGELVATNASSAVRNGLIATAVDGEDRVTPAPTCARSPTSASGSARRSPASRCTTIPGSPTSR